MFNSDLAVGGWKFTPRRTFFRGSTGSSLSLAGCFLLPTQLWIEPSLVLAGALSPSRYRQATGQGGHLSPGVWGAGAGSRLWFWLERTKNLGANKGLHTCLSNSSCHLSRCHQDAVSSNPSGSHSREDPATTCAPTRRLPLLILPPNMGQSPCVNCPMEEAGGDLWYKT